MNMFICGLLGCYLDATFSMHYFYITALECFCWEIWIVSEILKSKGFHRNCFDLVFAPVHLALINTNPKTCTFICNHFCFCGHETMSHKIKNIIEGRIVFSSPHECNAKTSYKRKVTNDKLSMLLCENICN